MYCNLSVKMFVVMLCTIFCMYLQACSHDNSTTISSIYMNDSLLIVDIDHSVKLESINYSDFYSNIETLILECDTNILIGYINKLETYNDYLIILDINYSQGIFVFDKYGNFIRKIGAVGQGVGEYIEVSDFTIDKDGLLYLLDNGAQRINIYELSSGDFIKSLKINENGYVWSYHIYKNTRLYVDAYFSNSLKNAYLLQGINEKSGYSRQQYLSVNDYNKTWVNINYVENNAFYISSMNSAFFVQQFMDTIIKIEDDYIYPFAVIKYDHFVTDKDINAIQEMGRSGFSSISELFNKNLMWNIRDIRIRNDYLFFRCWESNMQIAILYDMKKKETYKIMYEINDLLYKDNVLSGVPLKYLTSDENGSYFCVRTDDIEMLIAYAKENMLSLSQKQLDKINSLSDDSNPVIIYYEYN